MTNFILYFVMLLTFLQVFPSNTESKSLYVINADEEALDHEAGLESHAELKLVHLIWRHGDRNPEFSYKNDPYKDISYWPDGYGQLTQMGIKQQKELGQFLRRRYIDTGFISKHFDPKEVYIESSGINRTIMSALSNLQGFFDFEPINSDKDNGSHLQASTIPVNVIPVEKDNKLLQHRAPCPKWDKLYNDFQNSPLVNNILVEQRWLFDYLTNHTGQPVKGLFPLAQIYNVLYIQNLKNFTLPSWTKEVFPGGIMEKLADFGLNTLTYTDEMKRLRAGPLLNEIVRHIEDYISGRSGSKYRKLFAYSAHDMTITSVLDALGLYDGQPPNYASLLMIELKKNRTSGTHFVEVLYRNDSSREPYLLHPPGCPSPSCDFNLFHKLFYKYLPTNWYQECQLPTNGRFI